MKRTCPKLAPFGTFALFLATFLAAAPPLAATDMPRSQPQALPPPPPVPQAQDTPWPGGPIALDVDASDVSRAIWRVTETIPLAPGTRTLTLMLPQWIPGHHSPVGPIQMLADLGFTAGGKVLRWSRDPLNVYTFHLELPEGTREVVARFVHVSPLQGDEGQIMMTREMLNLEWHRLSLYPAGHYVRRIRVRPRLTVPEGWGVASALDGAHQDGARVTWAETDYETLVDSPVFAGSNFKRFDLGHAVALNVVADKAEQLALKPEHLATYKALVEEALLAFGTRHFDHYDFLLGLTDRLGGVGLEHHRSSENTMAPATFTQWADHDWSRGILPHEFTHSWNGKFRRPAALWTPDYREPMQDNLLWVYEGQTTFWEQVLAARSGVQSKAMILGEMAGNAALFGNWPGRAWRSLEDTTFEPIVDHRQPRPFPSLTREEDYYAEGSLVWLEVDQIIREGTGGARGLDDFARAFFGLKEGGGKDGAVKDSDWGEVTYSFDDVVAALNLVYPHDWAGFLHERVMTPGQSAPTDWIARGGYRLVWKDEPNPFDTARMASSHFLTLFHSLGVTISAEGKIMGCRWDGPAFNAGLMPGAKILAVDGEAYSAEAIKAAITQAKGSEKPIELIYQRGDKVMTVALPYHDGLRYPWLERATTAKGAIAGLDALLAPRRAQRK